MEFTTESLEKPKYMAVYSGRMIDAFNLSPEDIDIEDIAHSLSNLCRYGGHCIFHYSVAQHSVECSHQPGTRKEQLEFLMHDASEAYLNDLVRPIKHRPQLEFYRKQEDVIQEIIFDKFGLQFPFSQKVHDVDNQVLMNELPQLILTHGEVVSKAKELSVSLQESRKILRKSKRDNCAIPQYTPEEAEKLFLDRFYELYEV